MSSREVWHFEKVSIKDSEYAQKCGLKGDCYFWVSKGLIKIEQLDRKTSFQITVSHIRWQKPRMDSTWKKNSVFRNWGASSKIFFLELGTRSPTGHGRLEMSHKVSTSQSLLNDFRDCHSGSKLPEAPCQRHHLQQQEEGAASQQDRRSHWWISVWLIWIRWTDLKH